MDSIVPYTPAQREEKEGFSLKEKIGYSVVTLLTLGAVYHFGKKFIQDKREANSDAKSFEDGTPQTIAKQLKMAFENDGWLGTDTKRVRFIMTKLTGQDQWPKIEQAYKDQFHSLLNEDMKKELQSSEYDEMLQIKEGKPVKTGQAVSPAILSKTWAKRLKAAFDKMYGPFTGLDEDNLKTVFQEIPTVAAFVQVGVAYGKEYKRKLMDDLKDKLHMWDYSTYMNMITSKPKS